MTLDEAIIHCEEVAEEKEGQAWEAQLQGEYGTIKSCKECAEEHRQLAEWLDEFKKIKTYPFKIKDSEVEKLEYLTATKIDNHYDFLYAIRILLECL